MNKKEENMEWKEEAPHLASLTVITPYSVPDKYFENLQERINQSVFVDGLMQKNNQGFLVPQNYFEELEADIEARIALDQINILAKVDGFKTPANYFDQLNANILSKTTHIKQKPKITKLWGSDLMKYAAAACFVVLTASGLYVNQQFTVKQNRLSEIAKEQVLYDIDENVIIEHLLENQTISQVSNTEMEDYILENYSSSDLSNNL